MSFVWGIGKASGHRVVPYLTNRAALWCWHPGPWPEGKTRCAANEREQQNPGDKHWEARHFRNKVVINVCVVEQCCFCSCTKTIQVCLRTLQHQFILGPIEKRQHFSDPSALRDEPYTWGFMSFCVALVLLGLGKCIIRPHCVHTGDGKLNVQATDRWRPGYRFAPTKHPFAIPWGDLGKSAWPKDTTTQGVTGGSRIFLFVVPWPCKCDEVSQRACRRPLGIQGLLTAEVVWDACHRVCEGE